MSLYNEACLPPDFFPKLSKKLAQKYTYKRLISSTSNYLVLLVNTHLDDKQYIVKIENIPSFWATLYRKGNNKKTNHPTPIIIHKEHTLLFSFYAYSDTTLTHFLSYTDTASTNLTNNTTQDTIPISHTKDSTTSKLNLSSNLPLPLYGLLLFCGCIFLVALYHTLTTIPDTKAPKISHAIASTNTAIADESVPPSHEILPTATLDNVQSRLSTTPVPDICTSKKQDSPDSKTFLNLTKKEMTDDSIKKYQNKYETTTILVANNNNITSCRLLSNFTCLTELYLHKNQIHSLKGLSNCQSLSVLVLSNNKITTLSELSKLKELTCLDLSHNTTLGSLKPLASLKKLNCLIITNSNYQQKEILYLQKKLPSCTILY